MGLDIRIPIGLLFVTIGGLLTGFGWLGDQSIYDRSLQINVNFWWGLFMLIVGSVFLWLARRRSVTHQAKDRVGIPVEQYSVQFEGKDRQ